jgi:protein O-GlcNAc transferase
MQGTAHSRLLLEYGGYEDRELRDRYVRWLAEHGISAERVDFAGHSSLPRFLSSLSYVDVALDPFPYSGETTALHTLWMGVPLVALEGETLARRLASRVLRIARLDAWVAQDEAEYVRIATALAGDTGRLRVIRQELRGRLRESALFDYPGVTRELEAAYRGMWQRWCQGQTGGSLGTG